MLGTEPGNIAVRDFYSRMRSDSLIWSDVMSLFSRVTFGLAVFCLPVLLACGDSKGGKGSAEEDAGDRDADVEDADGGDAGTFPRGKARLRGRVTYADGTAVGQATLRIGERRIKSDSRGVFAVDDLVEGELTVTVDSDDQSAAQIRVQVSEDHATQAELFVLPRKSLKLDDAAAADEVADGKAAVKVKLPKKALRVTSTGRLAEGAAEARVALVKESRDLKAAPGRLKGTRKAGPVDLDCFGMVDMRFAQAGEALELAEDAQVTLALGPNSFEDQEKLDVWFFDPDSGLWKNEGRATVDRSGEGNGVATFSATHAAWWTVARPAEEETCVKGRLFANEATPLAHAWIQAVSTSEWGTRWAETDDMGSFCLSVSPSSTYSLSAFGREADRFFEWQKDISAGAEAAMCGDGASCTDAGKVMGASLFDECKDSVSRDQNQVLLFSSTDDALDKQIQAALEANGHSVTIGPHFAQFDGSLDLSGYDALYLQANLNWGGDMPAAGQRQLINWVNCGGGLVTVEWTTWKIGTGGFQLIDAIFPVVRTNRYVSDTSEETYVKATDEPTLKAGLPDSFSFPRTSYGGTESYLDPRPGAVVYYESKQLSAGLLGWDYNLGRVASFSTTAGTADYGSADFARLVANALDWVQRD